MQDSTETSVTDWKAAIAARNDRAKFYFDTLLDKQLDWYDKKAGTNKKRHLALAIAVIVLGALVTCLQLFQGEGIKWVTAGFGALIAILQSFDTLLKPNETWQAYRRAFEGMKREQRMYVNNADVYKDATDEQAAYQQFVERVEYVLAEEKQIYWQMHTQLPNQVGMPTTAKTGETQASVDDGS